jgi:hypothetical protein
MGSKKATVMVAGVIVAMAARLGLDLDPAAVAAVVSPVLVYIAGQAFVDAASKLSGD